MRIKNLNIAKKVIDLEINSLQKLKKYLNKSFNAAINAIVIVNLSNHAELERVV